MKPAHYDVKPGTKVIYMDCNGYARENVEAREKGLVVDTAYEVESADVYDSRSYFHLKGIEGAFNTVMFTLADDSELPSRDFASELYLALKKIEGLKGENVALKEDLRRFENSHAILLLERDEARKDHLKSLERYAASLTSTQAQLNVILERINAEKNR
jgi:hypothetical protein